MTRDEFNEYRLSVLAKTNGSNVHYIHSRLGQMSIAMSLLDITRSKPDLSDERIEYYKNLIPICVKEIEEKLYPQINVSE